MPELKSVKVRIEIEFEVRTSGTLASAVGRAEDRITPALRADRGVMLGEPDIRSARITQIEMRR